MKAQRGQALVPVIFVMLIMTVIAVGFAVSAQREVRSSANFVAETQRFRAAQGALNYAMSALAQSSTNGATYGVIAPMPDTDDSGWSQVGDAWVKIEAIDTGAYLNINNADLAALQKIPVLHDNSDLASAILEWRTPPSSQGTPSSSGSADYYQQQQPPYTIKGAAYDTVEELLLVKGMTPAILYGTPSGGAVTGDKTLGSSSIADGGQGTRQVGGKPPGNPTPSGTGGNGGQNGAGQAGGAQTGGGQNGGGQTGGGQGGNGQNGNGQGTAATAPPEDFSDIYSASTISLAQLLTTATRERNIAADGSARININTATQQDLTTKLGLTPRQARSLIGYRTPISNNGGGGNGIGAGNNGGGQQPSGNGQPGSSLQSGGQGGGSPNQPISVTPGESSPRSAHRFTSRQAPSAPGGGGAMGGGMNGGGPQSGNGPSGGQNGGGNSGSGGGNNGTGTGGNNSGSAPAPIFKTIADLLDVPGFNRTVMQQVADKVSVDDSPTRENVININTAPGEVLATVPGMDHATLTAILQYRQGGQAFQTLSDLFSLQDIGRETFKKIIPYLSAKSSVYYVRIKVRTSGQQGMYAAIGTVELKSDGAHILQWREVQRKPGWADWTPFQKLPSPTPSSGGSGGPSPAPSAGGAPGQ